MWVGNIYKATVLRRCSHVLAVYCSIMRCKCWVAPNAVFPCHERNHIIGESLIGSLDIGLLPAAVPNAISAAVSAAVSKAISAAVSKASAVVNAANALFWNCADAANRD